MANGQSEPAADLTGESAVFATGWDHRICFWNGGAVRVFGLSADEALGQRCYDVLRGRDVFGNRFCYENCPVMATAHRDGSVAPCRIDVEAAGRERRAMTLSTLRAPEEIYGAQSIVHVLHPLATSRAAARAARGADDAHDGEPPLTPREREVLQWVALGLQNKEIARTLDISLATVRNHVHNMLDKLGVHSKLEAVSLAFRKGWVARHPGAEPGAELSASA
jgi:DNA-binding CsgD family transcriptional regulator